MKVIVLSERFKSLRKTFEGKLDRNLTEEEIEFIVWIIERENKTKNVQYSGAFFTIGQ